MFFIRPALKVMGPNFGFSRRVIMKGTILWVVTPYFRMELDVSEKHIISTFSVEG
jgi:hypothetical protein